MKKDFLKIFVFITLLWIIHMLQNFCAFDSSQFTTSQKNGIISIFTGVFLHANYLHLCSNTASLIVSLFLLFRFYKSDSFSLILLGLFIPSTFVYILDLNVLGISGLVFALMWFLMIEGLKSENKFKFLLSIFLCISFGNSLLTGMTPMAGYNISWQAHLGGFIVAVIIVLRKLFTVKTN